MQPLGTFLHTLFFGTLVGRDEFGNRYYMARKQPADDRGGYKLRRRRWVAYNGRAEASKIPPLWNAWLHYTIDESPLTMNAPHYAWEKEHLPNLTGTAIAYVPPGHISRGSKRAVSTSDYQPWTPL